MNVYYNEHDRFAAEWLRGLIAGGHLPAGHIDERDIQDVQPADLRGFQQCHFFAGIGGWALALELAGWGDRPVWTGSCPCQPYSSAGKGEGAADARNLWPAWFRLIRECRPVTVFGEQVEAAVRHGWLDAVSTDLEAAGYAFGAVVLGAHSVGAPHIRQRLWWVADGRVARVEDQRRRGEQTSRGRSARISGPARGGDSLLLADSQGGDRGLPVQQRGSQQAGAEPERGSEVGRAVADPAGARPARTEQRGADRSAASEGLRDAEPARDGAAFSVGDTGSYRREGRSEQAVRRARWREEGSAARRAGGPSVGLANSRRSGGTGRRDVRDVGGQAPDAEGEARQRERGWNPPGDGGGLVWLPCRDGKARPTRAGLQPLAHGVPNRVGALRGAGNAIVPQAAEAFIRAYLETVA